MDLKLDEQTLLAGFQSLPPEGRKELLDYAAFLVKKHRELVPQSAEKAENQCSLGKQAEKRPEAAKEPIFTE